MLQKAASNAYSWWWASHIRTKQSKWLEQSLLDMENKVNYTLKIIDEDGETFAQRAEMYYRKRPEIVGFVEEAFRSYRALAERFDHLSREFQSANRTIATVFPEHVPFPLDDEDEENSDKQPKHLQLIAKEGNIPKVPGIPKKDFRSRSMLPLRKGTGNLERSLTSASRRKVATSGLSKVEALEEIDKLQKGILALQTEKEFVRSLYENAYDKHCGIDNEITEMQKRVCSLQDEFGIGAVIDDSEARTLMASTALNSCKKMIAKLKDKQKESTEEARIEEERIRSAKEKFEALSEFDKRDGNEHQAREFEKMCIRRELGLKPLTQKVKNETTMDSNESSGENVEEEVTVESNDTLTVIQLVGRIDELAERVVSLETTASFHTALVKTLRSEIDKLHENIRGMEEDKASLPSGSEDMERRIKVSEEALKRVQSLYRRVKDHNNKLQTHFTDANCKINDLSRKLGSVKMNEDAESAEIFQEVSEDVREENSPKGLDVKEKSREEEKKDEILVQDSQRSDEKDVVSEKPQEQVQEERPEKKDAAFSETASTIFDTEAQYIGTENGEETADWGRLFSKGLDDRETILLEEYTSVLRNYREVSRKLNDVEKKNRDGFFELALQIRELKNAVTDRDIEIQSLRHKLDSPEKNSGNQPEGNQSDNEGQSESISHLTVSPTCNFLSSTSSDHEQGENFKKTPAKTRGNEVKVRFAEPDNSSPHSNNIPNLEKRVRADIDELLEENLEFWFRFSTSIHQIQKFQTAVHDLKSELSKLDAEKRKQREHPNSTTNNQLLASEARAIYRHLREIQTELQLWLENNAVLKDEVQGRYLSLCNIQDEISRVTTHTDATEGRGETEINEYQAAKFHGEVLNMKQENTRVSNELQAGLDRVRALKTEVERVLQKMQESNSSSTGRPRIPLRSFLFGVKIKKHKQQKPSSLFSCVSSPALQK